MKDRYHDGGMVKGPPPNIPALLAGCTSVALVRDLSDQPLMLFAQSGGQIAQVATVTVTNNMAPRWGEADANPFEDIKRAMAHVMASTEFTPNRLWMPHRTLTRIVRSTMTKRQWRRYRGRMKAHRRAHR